MAAATNQENKVFYLHFDVPSHRMPVEQYLEAIEGVKEVFESLNKEMFGMGLECNLEIYAPENGSLFTKITWATGALAATVALLDPDIPKMFIKGYTGKLPSEWVEEFGEGLAEKEKEKIDTDTAIKLQNFCVQEFLENPPETLSAKGASQKKLKKAYEGKNKFYDACSQVDDMKGVGFSEEKDDFPVEKPFFHQQIVTFSDQEKRPEWEVKTKERIIIFSPCWDIRENLNWQAKWKDKNISLKMRDDYFWKVVHEGSLEDVTTKDVLEVQIAIAKKRGPKTGVVLSVLSYNGQEISEPKTMEELDKTLKNYSIEEPYEDNQISMLL